MSGHEVYPISLTRWRPGGPVEVEFLLLPPDDPVAEADGRRLQYRDPDGEWRFWDGPHMAALEAMVDGLRSNVSIRCRERDHLRAEVERQEAELARLRPVVEAVSRFGAANAPLETIAGDASRAERHRRRDHYAETRLEVIAAADDLKRHAAAPAKSRRRAMGEAPYVWFSGVAK